MNKLSFWTGALLVVAPALTLVPGCGGGNDGVIVPTTTPTATILTPTPNGTLSAFQTTRFTLDSGETGTLTFALDGTHISGTLTFPQTGIPIGQETYVGTYALTGALTPPRAYTITALSGGVTAFTLQGQLPTSTQRGSYVLKSSRGTQSGDLLPLESVPVAAR